MLWKKKSYNTKVKHLKCITHYKTFESKKKKKRNQALLKDKHDKSTMIEKCHGKKKGATQQ